MGKEGKNPIGMQKGTETKRDNCEMVLEHQQAWEAFATWIACGMQAVRLCRG